MTKLFTKAVRVGFALLGLAIIFATSASTFNNERTAEAAYNAEINYQGKLTNGSNVAVADGDYNMEFKLYDDVTVGSDNLLWTETRTGGDKVTVTNGVFSVMLGEVNPFGSLDFNQTLFLSVNIGGTGSPSWDGEMVPRKKIGTVPTAFLASNLKGTGLVDITNTATQATFNYDGSNRATLGVASNGFTTLTAVGAGAGFNLTGGNVGISTGTVSAKLHVTATTEQIRVGYDAGNYTSFTTSSGGDLTIAPSGSDLAVTGNVDISGTLTAGTGNAFVVNSSGVITAAAGITSSGTITYSGLGGGGTQCVNVNNSGVLGVTTCGGALTPWTSDIDADGYDLRDLSNLEFQGTTGAPAGSVVAIFSDNTGDLNINSLTGKTTNIQVNGSDEYNFSSTALAFNSNNITGFGTGLTATAGLTITSTSANLALATATSGDITATTATTSGLFNVLTGNLKIGAGTPGLTLNGDDAYVTGTFEVDSTAQLDGAVTFNSTTAFNGLSTHNTDVDFTLAGTENLVLTNTSGSNAVDLFALTLTNNDGGSATQRGIVVTNADSSSTTEALFALDNLDTTANALTDYILITKVGTGADTTTDAIDVSDPDLANALNVGANTITGAGYTVTSTASGLTINSTSANLALQTTTSGNITLAPASTGSVQVTSGVTSGLTTSAGLALSANSLTTGTGVYVESSTLTSGSLVDLQVSGTAGASSQKVLNVATTGVITGTQTTYGGYFSNTHSGGTSTNVGLYATATGGTNNYAAIFEAGYVGVGTTSPGTNLTVEDDTNGSATVMQLRTSDGSLSAGQELRLDFQQATTTLSRIAQYYDGVATTAVGFKFYGYNSGLNSTPIMTMMGTGKVGIGDATPTSTLDILATGTYGAAGVSGIAMQAHTVTLSGADPTTYATFYANQIGAMTLVGTNANQTVTDAAGLVVAPAIKSTNVALTNTHGILIPTTAVSTATNAYGLTVNAPTGATNNYSAAFLGGNVGVGLVAPTSLLHVQQAADSTDTTNPVALDVNSVGAAGELTASSGNQIFARIAPTVNQTSTASYRALDVNVTETAVTSASGLNRLADFRVGSSSKLAIANDGTLTLQNASNIVGPYASIGAFQNHLVRSEEFDNASWTKTSVTAPTANTQVAPDGSTTAESLATSGSGGDVCQFTSTAPGSSTFTFSVWARSTSGTQNFDLRVDAGATSCATANSTTGTAVTHTATTSWQRFSVTQTFSGASNFVKVRIFPGGTGGTGTIYAAKAQLEISSNANAYALTTGGALTNTNRGESIVSNFATASGFTYGGRHIINLEGAIAASSTTVGQMIRVNDNATGTDDTATVRALEVQSYSGTNINGVNTAVAAFGYTFGIHAVSTAQANESAQPAAIFADLDNGSAPTQGNAIRAYSNNLTSADLVSLYQESSAFTGNGLELNFGNNSGSFSGNFISLQKAGTQSFHVDDDGSTFVSFTGTGTAHAVCHATNGSTNDDELVDCTSGPSADYAEMYPLDDGIEAGELVAVGTEMVSTYDALPNGDGVDWNNVKGQITRLTRSTSAYQKNLIGIVSDNYADFSSTGYNIKPQDNPKSVALKGRVLVKVTNENGDIKAGDYITSSAEINGYGTKATRSGQVVGQALSDFIFTSSDTGTVMVFVQTGYQSIGNTIFLDAPTTNSINLQSGGENLTTNAASTFVIQQQTSGDGDNENPEANILQLQTGDANRFMVSSSGATSILSNLNCETDANSCPSVLKVTQADTELVNIDARGTLTLAGTIVIKDDTFAGSVATDEDGLAEITFSYHLGTGKPTVQLTAEAQIPVFAQIVEFKQDENGNYTGFIMKTFDLISSPIQAIVHYNVVGKQAGYITLGEAVVPEEELGFYSGGGDSGDGVGTVIDGGEVIGNEGDEGDGGDLSEDDGTVSGDFTSSNPDDTLSTDEGSGSEPVSE